MYNVTSAVIQALRCALLYPLDDSDPEHLLANRRFFEAQMDRFALRLSLGYVSLDEEIARRLAEAAASGARAAAAGRTSSSSSSEATGAGDASARAIGAGAGA
jgi:hypothetical protein